MEDVIIKEFLSVVSGDVYGYGDGYGYGYGSGDVSGYGDGNGYGSGDVYGSGDGYGYGYGSGDVSGYGSGSGYGYGSGDVSGYGSGSGYDYGIKSFCGMTVYNIDSISTIIKIIKSNVAKGFILNRDFTLEPCFIIKRNNLFAHGKTLKEAVKSLEDKMFDDMEVEERIELFLQEFDLDKKYPAMKFFDWHNKLTGSCEMGRMSFAKNHEIDLKEDEFTVSEFIQITKNDFGGEVIKQLEDLIKGKTNEI